MPAPSDRLDSWKAIADYLGRDVRTLRRWEELGLPVRRVAGERGHSVFAFKAEIDDWLRRAESAAPPVVPPPTAPASPGTWRHGRWFAWSSVVIGAVLAWKTWGPAAESLPLHVQITSAGVVASDSDGIERWRYAFPPDGITKMAPETTDPIELRGDQPGVLVATSFVDRIPDRVPQSGILRWFSPTGTLLSSFAFDDRLTFGGNVYDGAWAMTDFRPHDEGGRRRIAVTAHHFTWWPSVVTILDAQWKREGTFVNSGWVESLRWLSSDRLAIAGYHEGRAGGMVAVLDTGNMNGASPEEPGSAMACDDCGADRPLSYVVLPRSELNLVTGSAFNRAVIKPTTDHVMVTTSEIERAEPNDPHIGAIFEFTTTLELLRASYDSRYWDQHQALERAGRITHTRETCPDRDGPPRIQAWDRTRGWRTVSTRKQ